ncbi:MAG TPA: hypothetical protein VG733_14380 [Chthoniobacteraceae bacterium]|nr:hypothetical protein [Chthoniobacteraceae bacterium]
MNSLAGLYPDSLHVRDADLREAADAAIGITRRKTDSQSFPRIPTFNSGACFTVIRQNSFGYGSATAQFVILKIAHATFSDHSHFRTE